MKVRHAGDADDKRLPGHALRARRGGAGDRDEADVYRGQEHERRAEGQPSVRAWLVLMSCNHAWLEFACIVSCVFCGLPRVLVVHVATETYIQLICFDRF